MSKNIKMYAWKIVMKTFPDNILNISKTESDNEMHIFNFTTPPLSPAIIKCSYDTWIHIVFEKFALVYSTMTWNFKDCDTYFLQSLSCTRNLFSKIKSKLTIRLNHESDEMYISCFGEI